MQDSTTTISTIAVRAGEHSTIVIALLKSVGYVSLRIEEMHPRMLEIGENARQTAALLEQHEDLMQRLKSKESQVEELLSRADNLVSQQKPPDVLVYEAMAESLGSAWKELNRQLQMRGYLLKETLRFYRLSEEHAKITANVHNVLNAKMQEIRTTSLNEYMRRVHKCIDEQVDITMAAIDSGADIISQIRVLGSMSDNVERSQETADACLTIEKSMLKMATEWELLEELWKSEKFKIEAQIDQSGTILAHIEEIEAWLRKAKAQFKAGSHAESILNQALQQKIDMENVIRSLEEEQHNMDVSGRTANLQNDIENFIREIKAHIEMSERVLNFLSNANSMLNQLSAMETDVQSANGAMAGELLPLARQKAGAVIEEGRSLVNFDLRVPRILQQIEEKLQHIENIAKERIQATNIELTNELHRLETWIEKIKETLSIHRSLGKNLIEASEFLNLHNEIFTEIINKDIEVNGILKRAHEFCESDRKRIREMHSKFQSIKEIVEKRRQVGHAFHQVHKFARELESSFESLDALISSNRNFSNERLTRQMSEIFRMIEETLIQEKHQAEKFTSTVQSVAMADESLKIDDAISSVRSLINEHEVRRLKISEKWEHWQEAKVQEKKAVRIVEEIQMWQEETIEIIRVLQETIVKTKTVEEREEVKRKMNEVIRSLPKQIEKIKETVELTKLSESDEAFEKVEKMRRRQRELEEKLANLRKSVETMEVLTVQQLTEVVKAPEIVAHLCDACVDEGERFEFSAKVSSEATPKIQWYKDGRDIKDNIDYRASYVNGTATLTIDETFIEDSAVYTIRVENVSGSAESSARLVVKSRSEVGSQLEETVKPSFVRRLRNVSVTEGQGAILDCVVYAHPEPKVVWYKEEIAVKESERIKLFFEGDHCSMTIKETSLSDSGLYSIKASNSCGESTNFCRLTVTAPQRQVPPPTPPKPRPMHITPSLEPPLVNQVLKEGQRCMFQVRVNGEPKPQVKWLLNDRTVQMSEEVKITEDASGWSRLIIDRVYVKHSGMYTVIAKNEAGEARSGATLIVESIKISPPNEDVIRAVSTSEGFWSDTALMSSPTPPPIPVHRYITETEEFTTKETSEIGYSSTATPSQFIRPFQNEYTILEGEKFKADCLLIGNPRSKINWFFNDVLINHNTNLCSLSNIGDTYTISFEPVAKHNEGVFKMTAENVRGKTESVFVLHVLPKVQKQPAVTEHIQVTEEFGAYEYQQRIPDSHMIQKQITSEEVSTRGEQRRIAAKQPAHTTRLATPPPTKKKQLQHKQQQQYHEQYDVEETWRSNSRPPHFTDTLMSAVAACGDVAKFEGVVTGWPSPELQWTKDGEPISRKTHPDLHFSNIGGRVSLTFASAQLEHAGKYMCTAKNSSGVATSSAQLLVRPKTVAPDFVRRLISEEVGEGEELKWTVQVTGDPPPKIIWLRDGQVIPNCEEVRLIEEGSGVYSMIIVKVELADSGQFTCLAENVAGEARSTADLVVRPEGTQPGNYFHVTKVTQEKQVKGEEVNRNESFAIENPYVGVTR